MLRLMLLRHAKSSWTDMGKDDRDRPITSRGRKAAQAMGRAMLARGYMPDLVLCSPAERARTTWALAAGEMRSAPRTLVDEDIYDFGNGGKLASALARQGGSAAAVLIVGHNPSLERLAARLAASGSKKLRNRITEKYPTGALAVIDLDAPAWYAISDHPGALIDFIRPRDIMADGSD